MLLPHSGPVQRNGFGPGSIEAGRAGIDCLMDVFEARLGAVHVTVGN